MQIFPRQLNLLPIALAVAALGGGGGVVFLWWYYFVPENLYVGYQPEQPIDYSHRLHAGELGIDCRYCHANVERSHEAMVPPTQTCMGCHSQVRKDSPQLRELRRSWKSGEPVEWVRVHKLPDHAYFDHSVHVAAGVGCKSCHGRVDQMEVVRITEDMSMEWCLECHRDPASQLRPEGVEVTDMEWEPSAPEEQQKLASARGVNPPTHCSGCHR